MEQIIHNNNSFKLVIDIHIRRVCVELFNIENNMYSNVYRGSIRAETDIDKQIAIECFTRSFWAYFNYNTPNINELWSLRKEINNKD